MKIKIYSSIVSLISFFGICVSIYFQMEIQDPCRLCLIERNLLFCVLVTATASIFGNRHFFASMLILTISLIIASSYHLCIEYGLVKDFCALSKVSSAEDYAKMLFIKKKSCANPAKLLGLSLPLWSDIIFASLLILMPAFRKRAPLPAMFLLGSSLSATDGKFINPVTDVCWECVFPIKIGISDIPFCFCTGIPPRPGIPMTFWEPCKLIDVTRHAYKMLGLGGISIGSETIKNRGTVASEEHGSNSFYHVHFYSYPVFEILKIFTDIECIEKGDLTAQYLSELDPTWANDSLSLLVNAEAALFSSRPAQAACAADCIGSNLGKSLDKLFWCAGCQGSLYPFTGHVSHHVGALQASSLLMHRVIAKLHRCRLLRGYEDTNFCEQTPMPIIKKSLYKTQLVYPVSQTKGECHPIGKSDVLWGTGKAFPVKGEDFVFFLWVKKHYCLSPVDVAKAMRAI